MDADDFEDPTHTVQIVHPGLTVEYYAIDLKGIGDVRRFWSHQFGAADIDIAYDDNCDSHWSLVDENGLATHLLPAQHTKIELDLLFAGLVGWYAGQHGVTVQTLATWLNMIFAATIELARAQEKEDERTGGR